MAGISIRGPVLAKEPGLQTDFRKSVLLTASGLALGILSAFELTRFVASLLFGVAPADPITFLGVASLIGATTFGATYLPARRATRVDPMIALRDE